MTVGNLIQVIGWRTRQPQLVSGPESWDGIEGQTIYQTEAIVPDAFTEQISLPLWSGRMQVELAIAYDAPPTIPVVGYVTPSFEMLGAVTVKPVEDYEDALTYRAVVDFVGGRFARYIYLYTGSGYATATAYWAVTQYGSEET